MNEINSSKRLKYAVAERAEGDKILQVKSAEAEAEAKYLSGVGVAKQVRIVLQKSTISVIVTLCVAPQKSMRTERWSQETCKEYHDTPCLILKILSFLLLQRKAIVDGLRSSIVDFSDHVQGSSTKEVMDLLLLTQYFDMIRDVGSAGHCKTTFVPTSKGPADETRMALLQSGDK